MKKPLDAEAMHAAAQALVGQHDFTTFRDAGLPGEVAGEDAGRGARRREGDEVRLDFAARSFLHRQVRSMTGSLAEVGLGRWTAARPEGGAGGPRPHGLRPVAPADGLYLTSGVELRARRERAAK